MRPSNLTVVHYDLVFFWMHNHTDPMTRGMDGEEQFVVAKNVDGMCVKISDGLVVIAFSFLQIMRKMR